jgi:hypothetical protein
MDWHTFPVEVKATVALKLEAMETSFTPSKSITVSANKQNLSLNYRQSMKFELD